MDFQPPFPGYQPPPPVYQPPPPTFQPPPVYQPPPPTFQPPPVYQPPPPVYQPPTFQPPPTEFAPNAGEITETAAKPINWMLWGIVGGVAGAIIIIIIIVLVVVLTGAKSSSTSGSSSSSSNLPLFDGVTPYFIQQGPAMTLEAVNNGNQTLALAAKTPGSTAEKFTPLLLTNGKVLLYHASKDTTITDVSGADPSFPVGLAPPSTPGFENQEWTIVPISGTIPQAFSIISPNSSLVIGTSPFAPTTPTLLVSNTVNPQQQWLFESWL